MICRAVLSRCYFIRDQSNFPEADDGKIAVISSILRKESYKIYFIALLDSDVLHVPTAHQTEVYVQHLLWRKKCNQEDHELTVL